MSTKTPDAQEAIDSTDPRPTCLHVGTDAAGCDHFYMTRPEAVVVVTPAGEREWRQPLGTGGIEAWMVHIADARGWADPKLYADAASALVGQIETVET